MLDPLTALSLASNIVQFLSFTGELIDRGREIYNSADGILVEHAELEIITRNLDALTSRLLFIGSAHEQPVDIHRVAPSKPQKSSQSTAKSQSTEETLTELVQGCRGTSRQLVDALRELKLEGANKRWNSFRQALKSIWEEKKIKDLSERQERYRRQIDTTLLLLLRENITSNNLGFGRSSKNEAGQQLLGFIDGTKKWQAEVLDNLQRNDWKVGNADDLHTFSSQLSAAVKGERDNVLTSKILAKLRFQSMEDRHATIPEAHTKTFEWVFSRDISQSNQPSNLSQANCDSYLHWLQGGESLYWITGKPGSGKSTLMKFLCDDGRTDRSLRLWAGDSPLRTASFFFWNSGTTMQMSRLGLLQSLLYALIGNRNCLIPHLFPDRWKYYELFGGDSRLWSWSELSSAFATLLEDQSTKYFIFIDGLDEVDNDPLGIAEFVHRTSRSGLNIKICASSRPWNVFEDTFKRIPSLRMEELTRLDIFKYVSDILNSNELFIKLLEFEPFEAQSLATRITGKANGVFLWVRIVVRSLLDGLRDGDKIMDLHDRLQRLPEDLDDLFRKILDHVDTDHRTQTSRLFQLIQAAQESLTLLTLDLAEDGLEKAIQAEFGTMPSERVKFRADNMRRRLNSRCQLLLEAPSYKTDGAHAKVSYLHRTVKDFILQPDMWNFIISSADPNFNAHLALVGAFLHRIKTLDPDSDSHIQCRFWHHCCPCRWI
ncbi:hypothetical protein BKA61DRAFT_647796 [Leptodontidium sp. MPI-SDFR-AT-0119]|nr:hypothetical protein BKA61DRAFT_647796 [Leptodontidium sp. MPI-SDFR-AT-0119]